MLLETEGTYQKGWAGSRAGAIGHTKIVVSSNKIGPNKNVPFNNWPNLGLNWPKLLTFQINGSLIYRLWKNHIDL